MRDYSILLNDVYLYLKQYPNEKVNYSKWAKIFGLTRQTIAKLYKECENYQGEDFNIIDFHNEIKDKVQRAIAIINDLEQNSFSQRQYATFLKVARHTIFTHIHNN